MEKVIIFDVSEWDELVSSHYNKIYDFQQQDGCKDRGIHYFTVPDEDEDYENDTVPEIVNHSKMGVSFKAWLNRDLKTSLTKQKYDWELEMWWQRNFYPHIQMIANDLDSKGLLESGKYAIDIDW
jgi:hypothetical protein